MSVLIITSDRLNPKDHFNSSFELALAESLKKQRVVTSLLSVHIISPIGLAKAFFIKLFLSFKKNNNTYRFTFLQLARFFCGYFFLRRSYYTLEHIISDLKTYESVSISNAKNLGYNQVWIKAGLQSFSLINKKEKPTVVHGHSRFFLGASLANAIFHQYGLPYIVTEHSSYYFRNLVPEKLLPEIKKIYDESAAATAVSIALKNKVASMTGTSAAIEIVGNALPTVYMEAIDLHSGKQNDFTVISVARLDENKNHDLLINAFAKASIPQSRLIIIGQGETKNNLVDLVASLQLADQVQFKGELPQNDVRNLLLASDVLVVSSKVETFCVALIEAHACGIPVISTPCGGPEELIEEKDGVLLQGFSASELAEAIIKVYRYRSNYNKSAIRERAIKRFGPEGVAVQYKNLYEKVVNGKNNI